MRNIDKPKKMDFSSENNGNSVDQGKIQRHRQYLKRLERLRPIDDDFMRCVFNDSERLGEFVLRIILDRPDLIITSMQTQKDMKMLGGARSLCLDAYGEDSDGKKYDLEIQRDNRGADPYRARYHSSAIDVRNLKAGQEFTELPETYVIFITEHDIFHAGEPVYPVERINLKTGQSFDDGEHIIYVNGEYEGTSDLGWLIHDFKCTNAADMHYKMLRDRVKFLKESEEGQVYMCSVMEEIRTEGIAEGRTEGIAEGIARGIRKNIVTLRRVGTADAKIKSLLMEEYQISAEEADSYLGSV